MPPPAPYRVKGDAGGGTNSSEAEMDKKNIGTFLMHFKHFFFICIFLFKAHLLLYIQHRQIKNIFLPLFVNLKFFYAYFLVIFKTECFTSAYMCCHVTLVVSYTQARNLTKYRFTKSYNFHYVCKGEKKNVQGKVGFTYLLEKMYFSEKDI